MKESSSQQVRPRRRRRRPLDARRKFKKIGGKRRERKKRKKMGPSLFFFHSLSSSLSLWLPMWKAGTNGEWVSGGLWRKQQKFQHFSAAEKREGHGRKNKKRRNFAFQRKPLFTFLFFWNVHAISLFLFPIPSSAFPQPLKKWSVILSSPAKWEKGKKGFERSPFEPCGKDGGKVFWKIIVRPQ